jgi:hypothetical protein
MFDHIPVPLRVVQQNGEVPPDFFESFILEAAWPVLAIHVVPVDTVGYFIFHVQGRQATISIRAMIITCSTGKHKPAPHRPDYINTVRALL